MPPLQLEPEGPGRGRQVDDRGEILDPEADPRQLRGSACQPDPAPRPVEEGARRWHVQTSTVAGWGSRMRQSCR